MRHVTFLSALALVLGCQATERGGEATAQTRAIAEQGPPNTEYKPAFAGQTRQPLPSETSAVTVSEVAGGLENPWALAQLPDGRWVVTEKPGRLRVVTPDGQVLPPIAGVPQVDDDGQGGLLDVAIGPGQNGSYRLCLSYAEPRGGGLNATAVSCGQASGTPNLTLSNMKVVFRQEPPWRSDLHFGSRVLFGPDGYLYVALGERSHREPRQLSQDINTTLGKIVRLTPEGAAAPGNPFADRGGPAAQVWSYGHRNIQGAAFDASGALWNVEHGPRGGDELNLVAKGKNYGWPVITYGIEYSGEKIGGGVTQKDGMEQPVYYWDPVIAPGGMTFYSGSLFPAWKGDALIAGLGALGLVRLQIANNRVQTEERIDLNARVRDVAVGSDGAVYVVTDEPEGRLLRVAPAGPGGGQVNRP